MTPAGRSAPRSMLWLRGALAAFGIVVVTEAAAGFAGALAVATPIVGAAGLVGLGALVAAHRRARNETDQDRPPRFTRTDRFAATALGVALLSRLWEGLHRAHSTYDVLSYHLHIPATWRAAGRISVVPTPFGDQAPAYAPSNAELTYQLAMSLTGNLRLAQAGQAPFAALAALAIYATARQLGLARLLGCGAALAFLMIPEIWMQSSDAMSDLALASFFLSCVPFVLRLRQHRSGLDVAALGVGLGLMAGTKYVGGGYLGLLGAAGVAALLRCGSGWSRRRSVLVLGLLTLACGGFWYLRNVIATGDPIFPVTLRFGPLILGKGLYEGATMRAWTYHLPTRNLQPLVEMFEETGWGFLLTLIAGFGGLVLAKRPERPLAVAVLVAFGWVVLPYQQARLLFPAWGVASVMLAEAASLVPEALRPLVLAPAVVGAALQYPTATRLLVAGAWGVVTLSAALGPRLPFADSSASATGSVAPSQVERGRRRGLPVALLAGACACAGVVWIRACPDELPYRIGDHHDDAWAYVREQVRGRRIAYAGSNLPLPLWGWRLENTVRYVNTAGRLDDRLHDFRDVPQAAPVTAEPAPERARPDLRAWLANLDAAKIEVLFVARLYPNVLPSMPHDDEGFPVERAWADANGGRFHPRFTTADVRIYDVAPEHGEGVAR